MEHNPQHARGPDDAIERAFQQYLVAVKAYRERHNLPLSDELHNPQQVGRTGRPERDAR